MTPKLSILISSYNRLALLRRTLWAIARRGPTIPFEVVLVDDGSTDDILGELNSYRGSFPWTFIRFDSAAFAAVTGLKKFFNNPCVTNNIAFRYSVGEFIVQQGNEVIPWHDCYDRLLADRPRGDTWMVMSTTYDLPAQILEDLDQYGSNLTQGVVEACYRWPLQSAQYRSDVTNYISLAPASLWKRLNGYDERFFGGISAEDSDFVRRARRLEGFEMVISEGVSLHQYHGGKTAYYNPKPSVITPERFREGVVNNHAIYDSWDGSPVSPQGWDWGSHGVKEVIESGYR